uniref:Uncharacterized protein n=1 Tax=Physcomitrium patens TaxID=3218 RepID=A0A2K1KQG2_PHYPA|nr:hypothetical protein PHYPA_006904 [Physcomitrium patens]
MSVMGSALTLRNSPHFLRHIRPYLLLVSQYRSHVPPPLQAHEYNFEIIIVEDASSGETQDTMTTLQRTCGQSRIVRSSSISKLILQISNGGIFCVYFEPQNWN